MTTVQLEIGRLERERELRMQKLVHTRKEIKLLDKLRETQYAEYQDNAKKQHDKFVDDLVSYNVTIS
jgi:flagellar export protein FliJ